MSNENRKYYIIPNFEKMGISKSDIIEKNVFIILHSIHEVQVVTFYYGLHFWFNESATKTHLHFYVEKGVF